jgi:DNA-directed RNA polymerase specialized sigma24 family protein
MYSKKSVISMSHLRFAVGYSSLEQIDLAVNEPSADILLLDAALQKLAAEDAVCADLVKLRFFAGLTLEDTARALGISRRSADRYWAFARSWLYDEMRREEE